MTPLVLLGAGGLAREVLAALDASGEAARVRAVLDDDPSLHGTRLRGIPVEGAIESAADYVDALFVACIASVRAPLRRCDIAERVHIDEDRWYTVTHPASSIGTGTTVGPGSIILAGVVATADVTIGKLVVIMPSCTLTHDVSIGTGATLAAGVSLSGAVRVGEGAYLGSNCMVREGVTIGSAAVVGGGAVVLQDVPGGETWFGVPARRRESTRSHA